MSVPYYIKAPCHQSSRKQGYQFGCDEIKAQYDHIIDIDHFDGSIIDFNKGHNICKGYDELYRHIYDQLLKNPSSKIITIGGDNSISSATISAINDVMIENKKSKIKILWIDYDVDSKIYDVNTQNNLNEMVVSSLYKTITPSFVAHQKNKITPDQMIFYGLQYNIENDTDTEHYTCSKINSSNDKLIDFISNISVKDEFIHVVIDMKVFGKKYTKTDQDDPIIENGIEPENVLKLLSKLKKNIISMDIVEFNPTLGTLYDAKITREIARNIIQHVFEIKEKSINIFNEFSQFLIYRPVDQIDEYDIGWYILSGLPVSDHEKILNMIQDDTAVTITIDDDQDILVTKTCVDEQNKKSCYLAKSIYDYALFPNEKSYMCFNLIESYK